MKHFVPVLVFACAAACAEQCAARGADEPSSTAARPDAEKAFAKLSQLVGASWVNEDPKLVVEMRWDWAFNHKVIHGLGMIGRGSPREMPVEVLLGLDPVKQSVFYLDCHGGDQVFKGTVTPEGDNLVFNFETIVGKPARWREVASFPDTDTMKFTIFGEKDGKWAPVVEQTMKRRQPAVDQSQVVTAGIIDAPVDAVWAAFVTKEGQESWNVAHADIDLKIGGKMLTHYDPKGEIGDPNTIENIILSYEPKSMLSIQVGKPPEKFPYKNAIKKVWTVIRFEEIGPARTKLTLTGLGYGTDVESQKLRAFFDHGNAYTLKKLQEKLGAKKAEAPKSGG